MSKHKGPTEAGSGGKLGHRSMDHRRYNSEIKQAATRKRRTQDKLVSADGCSETADEKEKQDAQ